MAEAHAAREILLGMAVSRTRSLDQKDLTHRRCEMQSTVVANPTMVYTSDGDKVDEEYAADLRQKMKAPKASATKTARNRKGEEITGDYALALRKSVKRQVQLEQKGTDKKAAMTPQGQDVSTPWPKPRGSVAEQFTETQTTTKHICGLRRLEVVCHSMVEDVEETINVEWQNEETIADLLAMTKTRVKTIAPDELTELYVFDNGWLLLDMNQRITDVPRGGENLLAMNNSTAHSLELHASHIPSCRR